MKNGAGDPFVVRTEDLLPFMQRWVNEFDADHPKLGQRDTQTKGIAILAELTGIDPSNIRRTLKGEFKWTTLDKADRILAAMDRTDLLQTDIPVVPNPRWGLYHWIKRMEEEGHCSYTDSDYTSGDTTSSS